MAALAVVVHHAGATAADFTSGVPTPVKWLASYGYLGVDFFFVLSGFIIYHTRRKDIGAYAWTRLTRIYVPYLPVGVGMAIAYVLLPDLSATDRDWDWLASTTLLPGDPALIVAWTLQYELAFYLVFGLTYRRPILGVTVWAGGALAYNLLLGAPPTLVAPFLSKLTVEFLFGVLAARAVETGALRNASLWALPAASIYVLTGERVIFGCAMALLMVSLVRKEHAAHHNAPRWLIFLGAASYAIYLTHNPMIAITGRLSDSWAVVFALGLAAGTLAGVVYHLAYEVPALRVVAKLRSSRRAPTEANQNSSRVEDG